MIICPTCKEEIDDDSHYCDQCGQALLFCDRCGRVGIGRRCIYCGGLMLSPDDYMQKNIAPTSLSMSSSFISLSSTTLTRERHEHAPAVPRGVPLLTLYNTNLNIRMQGINGAVIGRRQGPYSQFFEQNMYISGVHAQLKYNAVSGWCIVDKHSSNGTTLNQHPLQPDVEMSLKNGDIVGLANINLQVSIT
jgi:hypothetical protein